MAIEDLTTYTEVDVPGVLTVTSTKVTAANLDDDLTVYLYKDFGVDFFNGFDVDFEILIEATSGGLGRMFMGFANSVATWWNWANTAVGVTLRADSGTPNQIQMTRGRAVAQDTYDNAQDDTIYYCSLKREANSDTVTLEIYSDSARLALVDTLNVAGFGAGTKYRYFYAANGPDSSAGGRDFDGYHQNFDFQIFIPRTGGIF